jgi:hypothetical protein
MHRQARCAAAGEKLIEHLKKWLEPEKLLAVQHSWDPGQECQIAAAILDLFYLLPPPAVKFLETQARGYLPHLAQISLDYILLHSAWWHVRRSG